MYEWCLDHTTIHHRSSATRHADAFRRDARQRRNNLSVRYSEGLSAEAEMKSVGELYFHRVAASYDSESNQHWDIRGVTILWHERTAEISANNPNIYLSVELWVDCRDHKTKGMAELRWPGLERCECQPVPASRTKRDRSIGWKMIYHTSYCIVVAPFRTKY